MTTLAPAQSSQYTTQQQNLNTIATDTKPQDKFLRLKEQHCNKSKGKEDKTDKHPGKKDCDKSKTECKGGIDIDIDIDLDFNFNININIDIDIDFNFDFGDFDWGKCKKTLEKSEDCEHRFETDEFIIEAITDENKSYGWRITDKCTGDHTEVWGDPHVYESDRDKPVAWSFVNDSDFMLRDGTLIQVHTDQAKIDPNKTITRKIDIIVGDKVASIEFGTDGKPTSTDITDNGKEVDQAHTAKSVFVMAGDANDWYKEGEGNNMQIIGGTDGKDGTGLEFDRIMNHY